MIFAEIEIKFFTPTAKNSNDDSAWDKKRQQQPIPDDKNCACAIILALCAIQIHHFHLPDFHSDKWEAAAATTEKNTHTHAQIAR